jgi:hypothetical protein
MGCPGYLAGPARHLARIRMVLDWKTRLNVVVSEPIVMNRISLS